MAFLPETSRDPASIGDISIVITDLVEETEDNKDSIEYEVQVLQADGSMFRLAKGNLAPHLTEGELASVISFAATVRQLAQALLPE